MHFAPVLKPIKAVTKEISVYLWDLRFSALHQTIANKLYHQTRMSIFEQRERVVKLVALFGSGGALFTPNPISWWLGLLTFIGVAASLAFHWPERSRSAAIRMAQYAAIQSDIERVGTRGFTEEQINRWKAQIAGINEPEPNRILWAKSVNEAAKALGTDEVLQLGFWQRTMPVIFVP